MNGAVPERAELAVAFTANEWRARHLHDALTRQCNVMADVPFDEIDPVTKYVAAALSFRPNRAEWWTMYQMHPLVERRRRRVLQQQLTPHRGRLDGLVMWGSWFHPGVGTRVDGIPYVHYIDQSVAVEPVLGEPRTGYMDRRAAHRQQARSYRDATAILTWSRWAREQTLLAHPTLDPSKVHAVGWGACGVDLSAETPNWAEREQIVLHVSNDFHRKGLDFLVETARRVRQSVPGATFVVVGKDYGGMKNVPQTEGVIFTGGISERAKLESYFRKASVFFLPHRFDRSPCVLVEAMSAGLPIVTSEQGGPMELVDGTGAGIALSIGDIDGYTTALTGLLANPERAARMGDAGRQLMSGHYNWAAVAGRILDVLRTNGARTPLARSGGEQAGV